LVEIFVERGRIIYVAFTRISRTKDRLFVADTWILVLVSTPIKNLSIFEFCKLLLVPVVFDKLH